MGTYSVASFFVTHAASQMWCLGRILPLLIGDLVEEDDENWDNFLNLLTIIDFVFAPSITPDKADLIAVLVEDFLFEFRKLYPSRNLTPKMHYTVHMSSYETVSIRITSN